jgi:hypothetical protein
MEINRKKRQRAEEQDGTVDEVSDSSRNAKRARTSSFSVADTIKGTVQYLWNQIVSVVSSGDAAPPDMETIGGVSVSLGSEQCSSDETQGKVHSSSSSSSSSISSSSSNHMERGVVICSESSSAMKENNNFSFAEIKEKVTYVVIIIFITFLLF